MVTIRIGDEALSDSMQDLARNLQKYGIIKLGDEKLESTDDLIQVWQSRSTKPISESLLKGIIDEEIDVEYTGGARPAVNISTGTIIKTVLQREENLEEKNIEEASIAEQIADLEEERRQINVSGIPYAERREASKARSLQIAELAKQARQNIKSRRREIFGIREKNRQRNRRR